MIKTVLSLNFPVEEQFRIRKQRILPDGYTENSDLSEFKRFCIVTGTHGDELEGQFVCYEVSKRIQQHIQCLNGVVDIYPALNPLGIDSIERGIPGFDLDMNRIFPGSENGSMAEHAAASIIHDLIGADMVIDIHASNLYLTEIPQVRISETFEKQLVPYAEKLNVDFIWVHSAATVLEATLAHSLNSAGTPTLVVEMGVGLRLTQAYGKQLTEGIFSLMHDMGIWQGDAVTPRKPLLSRDPEDVEFLNAPVSGLFIQHMEHNSFAYQGQIIGEIADPLQGKCLYEIEAPCTGLIFTLREFPVVDEGSLLGRILKTRAIDPGRLNTYEKRGVLPVSSLDLAKYRGGEES